MELLAAIEGLKALKRPAQGDNGFPVCEEGDYGMDGKLPRKKMSKMPISG